MVLSNAQILELIEKPANPAKLSRAKKIQDRLNFHAQAVESADHVSPYYDEFLKFVSTILKAKDKLEQFKTLLRFPLKSNKVVDAIADEYKKVFHAQNSLKRCQLRSPELVQDFEEYLQASGDKDFWETSVFSSMLTAINSLVVIDMDPNPSADIRPYASIVDINHVVDLATEKRTGKVEYLIYKDDARKIIALDDDHYRVYVKNESSDQWMMTIENPHILGYTPAKYMWEDVLSTNNQDIKQSPLTAVLEDLDWYLFFETAKKSLDLYAAYPIYWSFKSRECGFTPKGGTECRGGFVHNENGQREPCPACEKQRNLNGPGAFVTVPMPTSKDHPELREPIGYVSADTESLKFSVDESQRLRDSIIETATGKSPAGVLNKEAVNDDQVKSQFESQTNILTYLAENYEKINAWVVDTMGRLRYDTSYLGCSINYGTNFYLQSLYEVTNEYSEARKSGLPSYILESKRNQIEEIQNKDNPSEKERIAVLRYLEPYPDYTPGELLGLGIKEFDFYNFIFKVNFVTLINQFELQNGSIVEWGSALPFTTKIERLKKILMSYVTEQFKEPKQPEPGKEPGSGN